eukprot:1723608-Pyramimonas_sp.AAC.1
MLHDPIFALLAELEVESFEQALRYLASEFGSDDRPDSIPPEAYNALVPLVLPKDATGTAEEAEATLLKHGRKPAMLGSSEFWRERSHRTHSQAQFISERA